jgi:hypothetical protein
MTKCLIECLITYFYYLTDDYVVSLFCHLPNVYRELLEPSLINRVLILDCSFNTISGTPNGRASKNYSLSHLISDSCLSSSPYRCLPISTPFLKLIFTAYLTITKYCSLCPGYSSASSLYAYLLSLTILSSPRSQLIRTPLTLRRI